MHRFRTVVVAAGLAGFIGLIAAPLVAAPPEESDGGLLAGPKVEEQAEKQTGGMMGSEGGRGAGRRIDIPHQQWMSRLREVSLTEAQRAQVQEIMSEFAVAQREFRRALPRQQQEALERQRNAGGNVEHLSREDRESLRRVEAQRPKPEPYQQRIWDMLSVEQQTVFKEKLDELRAQIAERRERQQQEQQQQRQQQQQTMMPTKQSEQESGGGMPADPMMAPPQRETPAAAERPAQRRPRAAAAQANRDQLDRMAQRRLRFLLSRQSKDAASDALRPPGAAPTAREREFRFDEDGRQ